MVEPSDSYLPYFFCPAKVFLISRPIAIKSCEFFLGPKTCCRKAMYSSCFGDLDLGSLTINKALSMSFFQVTL